MAEAEQRKLNQDDEIDLIELLLELWKGKIIILSFMVFCLAMWAMYVKLTPESYLVSASYSVNLYSDNAFKVCGDGTQCLDENMLKQFSTFVPAWSVNEKREDVSRSISFLPDSNTQFLTEISDGNDKLTQLLLDEAKDSLKMAEELPSDLQNTDTVAETVLSSQRMVNLIENKGTKVLSFGDLGVKKQSPKVALTLVLSLLLGGMLGVFAVLLRKPFIEIKTRLSKDL